MPPEIVISEFMDEAAVDRLRASHDVLYDPALVDDPARLGGVLAEADALIVRNRTQVTRALIDSAPQLRIVGRLGVGLDNIDLDACAARDVAVQPATGANADAVAEYVIAAALFLRRGAAFRLTDQVIAGDWPRANGIGSEIAGATLGLIGFGTIARATTQRATDMGVTVIACDPAVTEAEGATILPVSNVMERADVLSLHVPLNDATRNMIDAAALARMAPGAILINTSRGGIVDEAALAAALHAGALSGAALDVFADEPLGAGSPLAGAPGLLATPHIAGVTEQSNVRVSDMIADAVLDALS